MIKSKRIPHVRGTEETAAHLAQRWCADEEKARKAAILHDCTKYLTLEEQLKLCHKYGILLDNMEEKALKLLHSKTGAAIARTEYGMDEEICSAIYWHTTGKADMTRLQKILYIADYMEPNRDFPGVERLRELVEQDLDAAVLLGLEMTMEEMEELGSPIHPNTLEARNWLLQRLK
jgi:nicotinate-nucleotide adenylyltransferase